MKKCLYEEVTLGFHLQDALQAMPCKTQGELGEGTVLAWSLAKGSARASLADVLLALQTCISVFLLSCEVLSVLADLIINSTAQVVHALCFHFTMELQNFLQTMVNATCAWTRLEAGGLASLTGALNFFPKVQSIGSFPYSPVEPA